MDPGALRGTLKVPSKEGKAETDYLLLSCKKQSVSFDSNILWLFELSTCCLLVIGYFELSTCK